ncbi:hypothetical protein D3C77_726880 [compost metagenome]
MLAPMSCDIPISIMPSSCTRSSAGTSACMPARGASVARAYPERSMACEKMV